MGNAQHTAQEAESHANEAAAAPSLIVLSDESLHFHEKQRSLPLWRGKPVAQPDRDPALRRITPLCLPSLDFVS
jgi:hypothetical protein